jgi:hypothetical protein
MAVEPEAIATTKCDVLPPNARGAILDDGIVIAGTAARRPGGKVAV